MIKVEGLKELQEALKALPAEIQKRPLRSAVSAGAKVIVDEAKRRAPQGETGNLRKALYRYRSRSQSGTGKETFLVGVRKGKKQYADTAKNRRLSRVGKKYTVEGEAFYWRFLEFGTSKMAARPFLRPAFESKKMEALDTIKKKLAEAIDRTAKRLKK
jgi:HK97 gp10 family phage protein